MEPGDVVWVSFPPRGGHAQHGRRPGIVMQGSAGDSLPTTLIVPLTTQLDALRFPGTVLIRPGASNGLRRASVALAFQIAAVDRGFLDGRLGALSPSDWTMLWEALDPLLPRPE